MRVLVGVGLAIVAASASVVRADPAAISLVNDVAAGKKPALIVTANQPVAVVTLDIERQEDHKTFHAKAGPLRVGQKAELPVGDGKSGHATWKGKLLLRGAWGESSNEVTFNSQVGGANTGGGVNVSYDGAHLDLDKGVLQFQVSKPIVRAQLTVVADDGSEVARVDKSLAGSAANKWLSIEWTPSKKNVLRLELKVVAANGDTKTLKLVPWSVPVAHEEVVFASGSSTIDKAQEPKLDASYQKLFDTIDRVRAVEPSLDVKVFIAGYTDTVGNAQDNLKLSRDRARSIAQWFRDHGLAMPVYYAGFGEERPRVKTPDNTDEPRNRRADYVAGAEEPAFGRGRFVELR